MRVKGSSKGEAQEGEEQIRCHVVTKGEISECLQGTEFSGLRGSSKWRRDAVSVGECASSIKMGREAARAEGEGRHRTWRQALLPPGSRKWI